MIEGIPNTPALLWRECFFMRFNGFISDGDGMFF